MFGRRKIAALVAELLGTGVLTLLVLSVQRSTIGVPFFVALAAGFAIMLMTFTVGSASGAHFNPAITIGMWTARKIDTITGILYIALQFLGAWGAYYLYSYYVNSNLQSIGGHYSLKILVAESVGTAIFGFGMAAAVYQRFSSALSATVSGLAYTLGIIAASSVAIGLLNPALALGVRAWVLGTYVLGPVIGAVVGINLYRLLFAEPQAGLVSSTGLAALTAPFNGGKKPVATKRKTTTKKK